MKHIALLILVAAISIAPLHGESEHKVAEGIEDGRFHFDYIMTMEIQVGDERAFYMDGYGMVIITPVTINVSHQGAMWGILKSLDLGLHEDYVYLTHKAGPVGLPSSHGQPDPKCWITLYNANNEILEVYEVRKSTLMKNPITNQLLEVATESSKE